MRTMIEADVILSNYRSTNNLMNTGNYNSIPARLLLLTLNMNLINYN
jgi:hypothetical protein